MTATHSVERRLLVTVDMERYSLKDNRSQHEAQSTFRRVLDSVFAEHAVTIPEWDVQRAGDSVLALVRADILEMATIVGPVALHIDRRLREHNRDRNDLGRVRLRMAVHEGAVDPNGPNGYPGDAVNLVCRLRDARIVKDVLRAYPNAGLAVIVSPRVHDDVVRPEYCGIRLDRFHNVTILDAEHDLRTDGWVCVPGEDVGTFLTTDAPTAPRVANRFARTEPRRPEPTPTYHLGHVDNSGAFAFGAGAEAYTHRLDGASE